MENYDDIINLHRPISKHPQMSLYQRSAQFAPFAALTGYEGQIKEKARISDAIYFADGSEWDYFGGKVIKE